VDSHPPASSTGIDGWAEHALEELTALPDVRRVGIALVEGAGRRLLFTASDRRRDAPDTWCHVDAYAALPLNDALGTGTALTGALDELDPRYDSYVAAQDGTGHVAVAAVPFVPEGQPLGGFVLYYTRPQPFDARQSASLGRVADRLGSGLREAMRTPFAPRVAEHHAPHGSLVAEHEIPADPAAVGEARRFLRRTLSAWSVDEEATDHAVLCLSELATNAIVHTGGGCHVQVELHDGVLTTRVHDNGVSLAPDVPSADDTVQNHGHGLRIVDALVSSWGRDPDPHQVWFALDVS